MPPSLPLDRPAPTRPLRLGAWVLAALALNVLALAGAAQAGRPRIAARPAHFSIDLSAGQPANVFVPDRALGAAIDGMGRDEVKVLFTPWNIRHMREAGFKHVTYRLRTELGIEAWHWTEEGAWSDPAHKQGYWVGRPDAASRPAVTWGYKLPRRGDTTDQANDKGYSRLDDGDRASFWKSNPWLDPHYTGEPDTEWVIIQLDRPAEVTAGRITWGTPFARHVEVQYWEGPDDYDERGHWTTFPHGALDVERSADQVVRLADAPVRVHTLRLLLTQSSHTAPEGASDPRDAMGFAIRELGFGQTDAAGRFHDLLRHGTTKQSQSVMWVSSTDPWHRASDRDLDLEQPGLDLVYASGLTGGVPMMIPVGLLYDNPDNASAEIAFLKRRGYAFDQVELGEEPDGQFAWPEHYAALYVQLAARLHGIDPALQMGGPSLQSGFYDPWLAGADRRTWTRRLTDWLSAHKRLADLQFFSFEHYPFDNLCGRIDAKLVRETGLMREVNRDILEGGVPPSIPWVISEYGFSAYSGRASNDTPSALLNADLVAQFLTLGGDGAFLFGYPPDTPVNQHLACAGFGNMMLYQAGAKGQAQWPMPALHGAIMLTHDWLGDGTRPHEVWPVASDQKGPPDGGPAVTAYATRRPDGSWAMLLINRDPKTAYPADLSFSGPGGPRRFGAGAALSVVQYGREQFRWRDAGPDSRPDRSLPPARFLAPSDRPLLLPPYSLTVVSVAKAQDQTARISGSVRASARVRQRTIRARAAVARDARA